MTDKGSILTCVALSGLATTVVVALLIYCRARLVARLSFGGMFILVLWALQFSTQPLLWCLSLLPSWDHLASPLLPGIGGGAYGLDYRQYLAASLVFLGLGAFPVVLAVVFARRGHYPAPGKVLGETIGSLSSVLLRIQPLVALLSVVIFVCYFSAYGWERLWFSQQGRFESIAETGSLAFFNGVKVLMPALLLLGVANGLLLYFTRKPLMIFGVALLCLLPAAVSSSRGFSLILVSMAVGLLWRYRLPQWLRFTILVLVGTYALIIPLISRGEGTTGLQVFFQTHTKLWASDQAVATSSPLVALSQSTSQGFPILVEALDVKSASGSIVADVPLKYWLLSISPTISMLDGYGVNYVMLGPRVNFFTPFSALAMLSAVSNALTMLFYAVSLAVTLILLRSLARHGPIGTIGAILVTVAFSLGLVQSTQYDLRTTMRFFYAAWECGVAFLLFLRFFHRPSPSSTPSRARVRRRPPDPRESRPA